MLLTHYLATISDRQLLLQEPVLTYGRSGESERNQWRLFPVNNPANFQKDFLISCKLPFIRPENGTAGLAWGFRDTSSGTLNRLIVSPGTGVWQAGHLLQQKQLTLFAKRDRIALHHADFTRIAILFLQGSYHFYIGDVHKPVYQCDASEMPMAGNGLAVCTLGDHPGAIKDLYVWQLTTKPCNRLSIEDLLVVDEKQELDLAG